MPSPFPGMDPYLESPSVFPDLHDGLIVFLKDTLQHALPEPYFAQSREHVWLEIADRHVEPDVNVMRRDGPRVRPEDSGAAVAVASPPRIQPVICALPTIERRELSLEIYSRQDPGFRLVTGIEVLSQTNKTPGVEKRTEYLKKQKEMVSGTVHLVEIDLLRSGAHTTAVPRDLALKKAGPFDYHVCVHRFDHRGQFLVYSIRLEDRLPEVDVPLLPGDGAVRVDLQSVFDRAYDSGPYRRRIRYGVDELDPPLGAKEQAWAQEVLAGKKATGV